MLNSPNLQELDPKKTIWVKKVASAGDLERAMRHYGDWLKWNKDRIILIDRAVVSERDYKIVVMYQLKDEILKPSSTF